MKIKCKNCLYFSGIKCHGHGEFYGECTLITQARKILSVYLGVSSYHIYMKTSNCLYDEICYEDSECKLFEIVK